MSRRRSGRLALAALLVGVSTLVDGPTGFVVGCGVVITLVVGGRPRSLILVAAALFALTPLSMIRQGLVEPEELSLQLVSRYSMTNSLAFAGFAYLVVGVLLEVHRVTRESDAPAVAPDVEVFGEADLADLAALAELGELTRDDDHDDDERLVLAGTAPAAAPATAEVPIAPAPARAPAPRPAPAPPATPVDRPKVTRDPPPPPAPPADDPDRDTAMARGFAELQRALTEAAGGAEHDVEAPQDDEADPTTDETGRT